MVVLLMQRGDREPSVGPTMAAGLARLGVTSVAIVGDPQTVAVVLEGWAFDPAGSADSVSALFAGRGPGIRTLQPVMEMAVSPAGR
ncbi:MAG: hypothetical protein H0X16_05500 [Chloroflexi bacterium]|nr:hypothetical protein [Chloroflexota bacterium]